MKTRKNKTRDEISISLSQEMRSLERSIDLSLPQPPYFDFDRLTVIVI